MKLYIAHCGITAQNSNEKHIKVFNHFIILFRFNKRRLQTDAFKRADCFGHNKIHFKQNCISILTMKIFSPNNCNFGFLRNCFSVNFSKISLI